jgi:hypothetical protein
MRISVGIIFSIILLWTAIFTVIAIVFRFVLFKDNRKSIVDLIDLSDAQVVNNSVIHNEQLQQIISTDIVPLLKEDTSSKDTDTSNQFAYVTLLHGIDDTFSYRGFLYNCLIVKNSLNSLGSKADFVVLIGFTYGENPKNDKITKDLALMKKSGILLHYLPRLNDITLPQLNESSSTTVTESAMKGDKALVAKKKKIPFLEMALLKITPWSFVKYKRIQFFDGDVLPFINMDCFFHLNINTFNTGNASPLNSGWFVAVPNIADFRALKEKALQRLKGKKWDEKLGWGTAIPPDLFYRGGRNPVGKWSFNGASLDQGLLTDYFVLHQGRVQLVDTDNAPVPVQMYAPGYQHKGITVGEALSCCGTSAMNPTQYFYHYTGKNKPWLQNLAKPKDKSQKLWAQHLDALKLNVNSTNINTQKLNSPLGYFYPNK